MTRLSADLLLLLAAFIWGLAFYFQKDAMGHLGPLTFIAARSVLAAAALAPFVWFESRRFSDTPITPDFGRLGLLGGLVFFIAAWLQQEGLRTATVINTGFLTGLYVVFTPFVAWAALRSAPPAMVWPATALSFAGTWLLGGGTAGGFSTGDCLVAACAVFWAVHVVVTGKASHTGRPFAYTSLQFAVVGVLGLAAALVLETPSLEELVNAAVPIAYTGLLSGAVTFSLLTIAMRHTSAPEAAILVSLEALFAAASGAILLGERLSLTAWTGAILLGLAAMLVQIRLTSDPRESPGAG